MVDVRETLLMELEALVEARARRSVVRQGARSEAAYKAAVEREANDLATLLFLQMEKREKGE